MKTVSSLVRRALVRAGGGVKQSSTMKQIKGPSKSAYNRKRK